MTCSIDVKRYLLRSALGRRFGGCLVNFGTLSIHRSGAYACVGSLLGSRGLCMRGYISPALLIVHSYFSKVGRSVYGEGGVIISCLLGRLGSDRMEVFLS